MFFKEYNAKKAKEGDISKSREKFKNKKNKNLVFLLENRFLWMKEFIGDKKNIIELGSGNGASKEILKNENIILTDIQKYQWISKKIDMRELNLEEKYIENVDIFIINHALHHCSNPAKLLHKMSKYLKKNGLILMNEPETSFFLKFVQFILKDEGWSFNVNIFDDKKNIFESDNPWTGNTAVAKLLFKDEKKFSYHFPQYEIIKNELSEFSIFLNSGGVINNIFYIPVNKFFSNLLNFVDKILIFLLPNIFALNRRIVLKKNK